MRFWFFEKMTLQKLVVIELTRLVQNQLIGNRVMRITGVELKVASEEILFCFLNNKPSFQKKNTFK